ncbi:hypothetical protein DL96DRAFT_1810673 [Flagelloscypha sp. PMI_526]|nr:hypothetical protein DL96DRAFT_1810673 [Flagelloscypha sp. PMI_526]
MAEAYDRSLAKAAPTVTNSQIEKGYDANLLQENLPYPKPEPNSGEEAIPCSHAPPFWRTRKGILVIVIAITVIIACIIGGAVGGAAEKKNHQGTNGFAHDHDNASTSHTISASNVSQTVAVLTTTLFGSDALPITTLTLSTTIELSQTDSRSTSLSTSQPPLTTTVVLTESSNQTTTVTAFFSTSTGGPDSGPEVARRNAGPPD